MAFEVIKPGFLTLIQDYGRRGRQHLGMTTGGPMDEHAFLWANHLLGNGFNAAALEITVGQLQLRATAATQFAIAGADLDARLNDRPIEPWRSYRIGAGDRLSFGGPKTGLRAYLAVSGGFRVPAHYGSCATVMREGSGGPDRTGRKLAAGDRLPFAPTPPQMTMRVPQTFIPDYSAPLCLRVLEGYQHAFFEASELAKFYCSEYRVSQQIDRMGYRLSGPPVASQLDGIISEGISFGAIQLPKDGQPIVLLRDRQTIGGYPKLGCVASLDAGQLSQRAPGAPVRFRRADFSEVEAERLLFDRFFGIGRPAATLAEQQQAIS